MYYSRAQVARGRTVINIGVIILNILVLLNFPYDFFFENARRIEVLRGSIVNELFVIIVTFFYYRGNRLASWFMAFFLHAIGIRMILMLIMLVTGLLTRSGLMNLGDGILYILVPVILVIAACWLISRIQIYEDCIAYWIYQKENARK